MIDVVMPQMGESIVEGTITKWLKQVGDTVEKDEALFEISTDKVDSEVPAEDAGVLKEILAEEGTVVEINKVVARLELSDGSAASAAPKAEAAAPTSAPAAAAPAPVAATPAPAPAAATSVRSSPLVKRIAREKGVDLSQVAGTGQGGRISKKDLEAYLSGGGAPAGRPATPGGGYETFPAAPDSRFGSFEVQPLSSMRKAIAEHMVRSMHHTAPHVSMVHQFDCTTIVKVRAAAKNKFLEQNGTKLTFMPFFLKAAAAALKEYPTVNASLDRTDVVTHRDVNIGVAVALDSGLMVPVIRQADSLSVVGLQKAVNDIAERARNKKLKPDELSQSTFSISNYGGYGSIFATPAINQPNSALLGLGALHKAPIVIDDAIAIRSICYATLTIDHRLVDGALAAMFLEKMRSIIENWNESVL
jgi:2-oxoglutarate dehydrogenase E2 component (dihydrolipoamide succinyltransferase)